MKALFFLLASLLFFNVYAENVKIGYVNIDEVIENNGFRKDKWRASHLRTFKTKAWKQIDLKDLTSVDGVNNLISALDELYLTDETCSAYEAYEMFERFTRPTEMSINDFIIQFERLYNKAKSHGMEIHEGVLAYRLLNGAK